MANTTTSQQVTQEKNGATNGLIDAFQILNKFKQKITSGNILIFLDYDGTLSPIVDNPTQAKLPLQTKKTLDLFAQKFSTIIISGRAHNKIYDFVQNDQILYCGSHGLQVNGVTKGLNIAQFQVGTEYLPLLQMCAKEIQEQIIDKIKDSEIEWNGVCFTIHYRRVGDKKNQEILLKRVYDIVERFNIKNVNNTINNINVNTSNNGKDANLKALNGLTARKGKMVVEIVPAIEWNKGKCLSWVLDQYVKGKNDKQGKLEKKEVSCSPTVLYIGDDITDEDAFKIVNTLDEDSGFGIVVYDNNIEALNRTTSAKYFLPSTTKVESFLYQLLKVSTIA
jgi:trehalose 6-phosphate phosphatase